MTIGETEFAIEAYLENSWDHPFGFEKLSIEEAGAHVGITYDLMFSFGINGKFGLVDTEFEFLLYMDPLDLKNNVFIGDIENLNFSKLYQGLFDDKIPTPLNKFTDNFDLDKGHLSIAGPMGVTLFDKFHPGGLNVIMNMTMFDFKVDS